MALASSTTYCFLVQSCQKLELWLQMFSGFWWINIQGWNDQLCVSMEVAQVFDTIANFEKCCEILAKCNHQNAIATGWPQLAQPMTKHDVRSFSVCLIVSCNTRIRDGHGANTATLPSQLISKLIGPNIYPAQMVLWSVVAVCQCAIQNRAGSLVARSLLGALQGGFVLDVGL